MKAQEKGRTEPGGRSHDRRKHGVLESIHR